MNPNQKSSTLCELDMHSSCHDCGCECHREQAGPKDYQALAIDALVEETGSNPLLFRDYMDKTRHTYFAEKCVPIAVRSTAEALRLRDENAALREQVAKVRRETIEECAKKVEDQDRAELRPYPRRTIAKAIRSLKEQHG